MITPKIARFLFSALACSLAASLYAQEKPNLSPGSLDRPNADEQLAQFTKDREMTWPQIYDGKFWEAALAQKYGIQSIPEPILVDGDTGTILAAGGDARGDALASAVEKALAARKKS